jgi:hypothetical protein
MCSSCYTPISSFTLESGVGFNASPAAREHSLVCIGRPDENICAV